MASESLDLHDDFENSGAADDKDEEREEEWADRSFSFVRFFLKIDVKVVKNGYFDEKDEFECQFSVLI